MSNTDPNYLVPTTWDHTAGAGAPNTPTPPATGLPVENVPGGWEALNYPDHDADRAAGDAAQVPLTVLPTPMIGAIPFGGLVMQAGRFTATAAGQSIILGETGNTQPQTTCVIVASDAGYPVWEIVGDGLKDQPGVGFRIPIGIVAVSNLELPPFIIPCRRVTIRNFVGAGTLDYMVVGFPVPASHRP